MNDFFMTPSLWTAPFQRAGAGPASDKATPATPQIHAMAATDSRNDAAGKKRRETRVAAMNCAGVRRNAKSASSATKRGLQFTPCFLRPVAIRSRQHPLLPTVRTSVGRTTSREKTMTNWTTTFTAKAAAFALAVVTSALVLGSTVAGMQPHDDASLQVVALERVTVTAPRQN